MKEWHNSPAPIGRIGQPGELGPAYVFLASADGSFISGQRLVILRISLSNANLPIVSTLTVVPLSLGKRFCVEILDDWAPWRTSSSTRSF